MNDNSISPELAPGISSLSPFVYPGSDFDRERGRYPFAGLPRHHFGAILADPPWSWNSWSKTNQDRAAFNYYDVMSLEGIKNLPVADLAADNCVLFLWAINSMLPQAIAVMGAWGFEYKTRLHLGQADPDRQRMASRAGLLDPAE
jgi:hypothetical protein